MMDVLSHCGGLFTQSLADADLEARRKIRFGMSIRTIEIIADHIQAAWLRTVKRMWFGGKLDNENASPINALGLTSMVLSALTLLTLGTFIVLILGYYAVIDFRPSWGDDAVTFLFWFSPLISILITIVAIFDRKRGSVKQKKVAK
jgi:hypothetical protein